MRGSKYQSVNVRTFSDREWSKEVVGIGVGQEITVILKRCSVYVITIVWLADLLFDCRMITETMKCGRRKEKQKIGGREIYQPEKHFGRYLINPELIDKD